MALNHTRRCLQTCGYPNPFCAVRQTVRPIRKLSRPNNEPTQALPHPDCQASDCLIRWGTYQRWACTDAGDYWLRIQRVRCQACGRTHSLLPDFLHPHRHYVLNLLYQVTWLYVVIGLGFSRLLQQLPEPGPAPTTVREWVRAFACGAGHLLLPALTGFLLRLAPQTELAEATPLHLLRSRPLQQQWLKRAYQFWQLAQQMYAQVKERQPDMVFTVE